jgi:hypothetical protein
MGCRTRVTRLVNFKKMNPTRFERMTLRKLRTRNGEHELTLATANSAGISRSTTELGVLLQLCETKIHYA